MQYIAQCVFCYVPCMVRDCCNLREHLNIWRCLLFRPRSTKYTERVSKHALSPSHALFSCNYPRVEEKMIYVSPDHRTFPIAESDRSLCHACASVRLSSSNTSPTVRIFLKFQVGGILQKFVDISLSWLQGDWKIGTALCANPRHNINATVNKRKTPMG